MTAKKRVLVICPYPEGVAPSQKFKYEQYFECFRENNIEISVSPFISRSFWKIVYKKGHTLEKIFWTICGYFRRCFDILRLPFYDGVYIHLWVTPFGPPVIESIFCFLNRKVIYDIDDMVFLSPASKANKFVANFKSGSKMIYLMKKAKHVIVCTPKLEEFARQYNSSLTDISSTINTVEYLPANNYANDHPLTLGWSRSHSTSKYMLLLEEVLIKLQEKVKFKILIIGDPSFKFKSLEAEVLPWNKETEIRDLQRIDIGLYPLPDEAWVYGKSGLKALQYMALGIPTVATAIGANYRVIEDKSSGYLVKTDDEWIERLVLLMRDNQLRKELGLKARQRVEKYFSVKATKEIYLTILKKVLSAA